ncbi:rhodanese-like domain-containing protein [Paenibacillus harenae]|uniref:rhodanese-like domain-containing protein n=1 Tax=Paenibacillus harenae TaxID=306543 RepID=UPI00068628B0
MYTLFILLMVVLIWIIRQVGPVHYLSCLKMNLRDSINKLPSSIKLLDVRDVTDFDKAHIPDSINISLGRLPFLWNKELSPEDEVMILADDCFKSKKAARILQRNGFRKLYTVHGPVLNQIKLFQHKDETLDEMKKM